ncbi:MAG: hypothetical protein UHK60_11080 [Acutalibacteraceae bacterium]|nr:hypothetical protein [Acutalibacteraceae bacterium]
MEDKALKIFNNFGSESQEKKLVEEVFGFLKAYTLYVNGLDTREHVVEEFSDVELLMFQFKQVLKITNVEQFENQMFKIERTFKKYKIEEK